MKKLVLLSVLLGAMPITMMAQDDDLYFVPTKENVAKEAEKYGMPTDTYYAGSTRSADEYNRRAWSRVAPIDSAGNDIIDFDGKRGVYPDSVFSDASDYKYTKKMSRFDGYTPSEAYWEGYRDGRWTSPWYYSSYYSWYDPWYYDPGTMIPIGDGVHLITIPHGMVPVIITAGTVPAIMAGMVPATIDIEEAVVPIGAEPVILITAILVLTIVIPVVHAVTVPAPIPTTTMARTILSVALAAVVAPSVEAAVEVASAEDAQVAEVTLMEEGDSWVV